MEELALSTVVRRSDRAVFRELATGEGGLVLDLDSGRYFGLNSTGLAIWDLLAQERTVGEVIDGLRAAVEEAPDSLELDARGFLRDLCRLGLVEHGGDPRPPGAPPD